MPDETKTHRSNCRFLVKQTSGGKPFIAVQLLPRHNSDAEGGDSWI